MNATTIDVDQIAAAYTQAKKRSDELKIMQDEVKEDLGKIKDLLLNHLHNHNLKSLTTTAGEKMHIRSTKRYSSGDWSHFKAWVLKNPDAIDLFENRLHQGNTLEWLKDHEGIAELTPPGLTAHTSEAIAITIPKG
jgi:hypothetical protein